MAAARDLLIAQISDTHLGSAVEEPAGANLARLDRVLDHLSALARRPDLLLVTGDLADKDDETPYRLLKERLELCGIPFHVAIGNHDFRNPARAVFGTGDGEFLHYVVETGPLRLIVLDTVDEGRHGGAFCETRSAWLGERLAEAPERPTLVVLHHPPIDTGIDWLTTAPDEPWLDRLDSVLAGERQVVALVAGHVHRPISASRHGIPVHVCPAVAPPITLDLAPVDPEVPDERPLVTDGPPGYSLHLWRDGVLVSHVEFVQPQRVLARFDEGMQRLIRKVFAERPEAS
jgi:3',5'-cyclic AMP phosphodiesterase CpdA